MDDAEFAMRAEPFRRELLAHCYRMLGSLDDAEDVVQETYLRAWRSMAGFEGRSSLRTWLYRIATNTCLTALSHGGRRVLPSGLGGPGGSGEDRPDVRWLQPAPDALVADPAAIVAARDSLRLALIASLQFLPPRQRAVLLLRDVLAWPAAEVAEALETTVAAVKSSLQRARARLAEIAPEDVTEPAEPAHRALLDRYVTAFENSDIAALEHVLRHDATIEAPPSPAWVAGRAHCLRVISGIIGTPGTWRLIPTTANGQPATISYRRAADGTYQPWGIAVLTVTPHAIARITAFSDPALVPRFAAGGGGPVASAGGGTRG